MSLLVWNCCGLGNLVTEKELGDYTRAKDPSVMFIAETWADEERLKKIKRDLQFDNMFMVHWIHRGVHQHEMWKPPPWPLIKVNFDGSVFRDEDSAGAGVVIRDDKGKVIASMSDLFQLPYPPNAVEIIAATKALRFALDFRLSSIVLEGDLKITIDALQSRGPSLVEFGNLIEEAKLLASQFTVVEFSHIRRQGNSIAHNIARHVSGFVV